MGSVKSCALRDYQRDYFQAPCGALDGKLSRHLARKILPGRIPAPSRMLRRIHFHLSKMTIRRDILLRFLLQQRVSNPVQMAACQHPIGAYWQFCTICPGPSWGIGCGLPMPCTLVLLLSLLRSFFSWVGQFWLPNWNRPNTVLYALFIFCVTLPLPVVGGKRSIIFERAVSRRFSNRSNMISYDPLLRWGRNFWIQFPTTSIILPILLHSLSFVIFS